MAARAWCTTRIAVVSLACSDALITAGVSASVGTVGDSYDNALAESVNGLYKAELIHAKRIWESEAPWV